MLSNSAERLVNKVCQLSAGLLALHVCLTDMEHCSFTLSADVMKASVLESMKTDCGCFD